MITSGLTKFLGLRPLSVRLVGASRRTLSTTLTNNKEIKKSEEDDSHSAVTVAEDTALEAELERLRNLKDEDHLFDEPMVPTGEVLLVEGPERDLVNFPRPQQPLYGGRTRLGFIPEEWFDFFYNKTGVTGPYVFGAGLITTLLSKELWVVDHEWPLIPPLILFTYLGIKYLGPTMRDAADKQIDEQEEDMIRLQESQMDELQDQIKSEEKSQWQARGQNVLFEAKRENIQFQLEAEYRRRLSEVYKEVKKRLDYQIEIQNTRRRVEQRHMVNWIVNNVIKNIDEKQESKNIDQCIANLKRLSVA